MQGGLPNVTLLNTSAMALKILFLLLLLQNSFVLTTGNTQKANVHSRRETSKKFPTLTKLTLGQNYPNPLRKTDVTTIEYSVVDAEEASIVLYDAVKKDKVLTIDKLPGDTGEVKISGAQLAAGSYTYALIINGRIAMKKKMDVVN
jgi:hypothetical protein